MEKGEWINIQRGYVCIDILLHVVLHDALII